eukprot:TRINITY_DN103459_c0_g1_i1.p1 TRINITY_DN103459_c0_g1~~TRINITY_DN103459_c0_g1_i1.p1  ORF type:complete len:406 (-),score=35.65 TRINITY_DN103459_c0_g1_i1:48-1097(-)
MEDKISFWHREKEQLGPCLLQNVPDDEPLLVVLTAGRGGLVPSAIEALKAKRNIKMVVYISCNVKTWIPNIEVFMNNAAFLIGNFRSFDFFPGTKYRMSYTLLQHVPKTLILPVGPPGAGKSTIGRKLTQLFPADSFIHLERDCIFKQLRQTLNSLSATKKATHEQLCDTLKAMQSLFNPDNSKPQVTGSSKIVYLDSTNGNKSGRDFYIETAGAHTHCIEVAMQAVKAQTSSELLQLLFERTKHRTVDNATEPQTASAPCTCMPDDTLHPSWPVEVAEQKKKIETILPTVEYPTPKALTHAEVGDFFVEKQPGMQEAIVCGIDDDASLVELPWKLFIATFCPSLTALL